VSFSSSFRFLDIYRFDSSTRDLDSNTALEFIRALWIATKLVRNATIVSIYPAGESLYEIFDKVCLLYAGRMVLARQYFIDLVYILVT
jgi:ATP-binding cassette subfamily G (WHITE) protein 2 (SNQ2)